MSTSQSIGKLAEALAKAQGVMQPAKKAADNPFFKSKYADLASVWDAARQALAANGLSVSQPVTHTETGQFVLMTYLMHTSGEYISSSYPIAPVKNDPQGIGSAITYARRYAFCAITGMTSEDEDDDGNQASAVTDKNVAKAPSSPFESAAERKRYCDSVTKSFTDAQTMEELKEIAKLNAGKFEQMDRGTKHDQIGVQELRKQYGIAQKRIKQGAEQAQVQRDSFGPGFADTPTEDGNNVEDYLTV